MLAEISEDIGRFSEEMDEVKRRQFRTILDIVAMHMDEGYIDVAETALTKLGILNKKYGSEFNDFLVEIYDKEALCLK